MGGPNRPGYHREYQKRRYAARMAEAREILGGRCVKCGCAEGKLDIDHIDPATKTASLSSMHLLKREKWLEELAKCQLLCASCHGRKTATVDHPNGGRNRWTEIKHGTLHAYQAYACRCEECREARRRYRAARAAVAQPGLEAGVS